MVSITGGTSAKLQTSSLDPPPHVLIGTPGRILDHLDRGNLILGQLNALVIDEADRLYDMNFGEQLEDIIRALPRKRQSLLFSATLSPSIRDLARDTLKEDSTFVGVVDSAIPDTVTHYALRVSTCDRNERFSNEKYDKLLSLVRALCEGGEPGIIFCNTRDRTDEVSQALHREGLEVATLHGGMEQTDRSKSLTKLRCGTVHVLVATDVAARGLDIDSLSFVVHMELPGELTTFLHRCGRIGRAGRVGASYLLADEQQEDELVQWRSDPGLEGDLPDLEWLSDAEAPQPAHSTITSPQFKLLVILAGKKDKLRKGDIIGGICGETNLRGEQIGNIEILPNATYVAIPYEEARRIVDQLNNARIKKKRRRVHLVKY
ncbi:hypothetical protein CYMTET_43743 [Cymbomonas tetramitiformis]|uniref:Uncharacterized protein n=1 Tax=Cymbomonas tetramitiformis TaxID=36881 RepID=A0AAE0C1K3_9CHLO|nr:hypothetical protein CYMTET_43743 [Cymbomonas tetramitiformis]|eukprot:gene17102-20328_t